MICMYIVQVYQRLEKGNNAEYWMDITVIVKDELHKLRKLDSKTGLYFLNTVRANIILIF